MALVDYSDSEGSDGDVVPVPQPPSRHSKGTFQKVVDRSNPGKIRVSLPEPVLKAKKHDNENPAKRIKTGSGGLRDFKSFLPPPKRTSQVSTLGGGDSGIRTASLAPGANLKTGTIPNFNGGIKKSDGSLEVPLNVMGEDHATEISSVSTVLDGSGHRLGSEVRLVEKPLIFKPLSVARNSAKKKKNQTVHRSASQNQPSISSSVLHAASQPQRPQVPLFPVSSEPSDSITPGHNGNYKPIIYQGIIDANQQHDSNSTVKANSIYEEQAQAPPSSFPSHPPSAQSLDDVAFDLNLSEADRRQLFGRKKGSKASTPTATKIINFNTDQEYKHNEEVRAAGEQVVHNPVRAIAPGKHSLKQLVNAAASQKEALEESFAKGKNNRAEASSRYGW